jgi:hypothetical protein
MAGIEEYETVQELDGVNLVPLLTDGSQYIKCIADAEKIPTQREANRWSVPEEVSGIDPERVVTAHFPHQWKPYQLHDIDYMSAVRKGDWKLVYRHRTQALELYNISEDITERNDLSASHPEKLRELNTELRSIYASVMANEHMMAYQEAQGELEGLVNKMHLAINLAAQGQDPNLAAQEGCTGNCGTCGGCH